MGKKPNILFLMTDEQRYDLLGYQENEVVRTPVLDNLSRDAVIFNNAYTPSPVCVPGRQAMMSGQLPNTCNCLGFGSDLEPGYMTFSRRLSQYGYKTVACGKLHHMGRDQMQGWTNRIASLNEIKVYPEHIKNKKEEIPKKPEQRWDLQKEVKMAGVGKNIWGERDKFTIEGALQFIDYQFNGTYYDRSNVDQPLLLKVSLTLPHYPYLSEEDKFKYYLNRVNIFKENPSGHPGLDKNDDLQCGKEVTEREIQRATAAYYAMTEQADEYFGKVLNKLEEVGEDLDDWIIIFCSDHGEMLGQHGVWKKQKFYEGSVKVPLFIRWPGNIKENIVVNQNVNLCDLFATICELGEIPVPEGLDSRSLVPLLKGETAKWNNETVSQVRNEVMIKWDDLKYQYYGENLPEVLFDLKKDPTENMNFIDDKIYENKVNDFRKRLGELGYGPYAVENYINAGY